MKKTLIALSTIVMLTSCITGTKISAVSGVENLKRDDYTIADEQTVKASVHRFYVLFIPIVRVGGKTEEARDAKALEKILSKDKADGVIAAKYVHKKWCVPLIIFNYSNRTTTLSGKPFTIKTDAKK